MKTSITVLSLVLGLGTVFAETPRDLSFFSTARVIIYLLIQLFGGLAVVGFFMG